MAAPTATEIREYSNVDFDTLGFSEDSALQRLVDVALATVDRWTGQSWTGGTYSGLPPAAGSEALARDAVQNIVEVLAYRKQADRAETLGDFDLLSGFSASGYSETRRSGKDAREASLATLEAMFWPLMSYAKQDEWREMMGVITPDFEITSTDWGMPREVIDPVVSRGGFYDWQDY